MAHPPKNRRGTIPRAPTNELQPTSCLINGSRQGTALAVPKSAQKLGVLTPEGVGMDRSAIYETGCNLNAAY
jgi:hypothetical protein